VTDHGRPRSGFISRPEGIKRVAAIRPARRDRIIRQNPQARLRMHGRPDALTLQLDEAEPQRLEFTVKVRMPGAYY
jgi:hypothetical protein